jgi:hypothetical protein
LIFIIIYNKIVLELSQYQYQGGELGKLSEYCIGLRTHTVLSDCQLSYLKNNRVAQLWNLAYLFFSYHQRKARCVAGRLKGGSFKQKKSSTAWKNIFSGGKEKRRTGLDPDRKVSNPELSVLAVSQVR